jgi:hypothetical protein
MEINTELLGRQLSQSSREIIETITLSDGGSDLIIYALNAIKVAYMSNRINDEEKSILKCYVKDRNMVISKDLLEKLTEGERAYILSLNTNKESSFILDDYIRLKRRYRDDEKKIPLSLLETSLSLLSLNSIKLVEDTNTNGGIELCVCCVCGEDKPINDGIKCNQGHFFCSSDLTAWVSAINDEREYDPEKFRSRRGLINCPHAMTGTGGTVLPCSSGNYSHANVCKHISDEDVLEKYIEGIKYIQALTLFADYQLQVLTEIENLKAEIKNDIPLIDVNGKTHEQLQQLQAARNDYMKKQQKRY